MLVQPACLLLSLLTGTGRKAPTRSGAIPRLQCVTPATASLLRCFQGCKCLIAIERAKLELGKPDPDSAYWN